LSAIDNLPQAPVAFADEINFFIETQSLFGLGMGLIDAHLLAVAIRLNLAVTTDIDS
jgi:hypothetical protein